MGRTAAAIVCRTVLAHSFSRPSAFFCSSSCRPVFISLFFALSSQPKEWPTPKNVVENRAVPFFLLSNERKKEKERKFLKKRFNPRPPPGLILSFGVVGTIRISHPRKECTAGRRFHFVMGRLINPAPSWLADNGRQNSL